MTEAERLAQALDTAGRRLSMVERWEAADLLRSQAAEIERLKAREIGYEREPDRLTVENMRLRAALKRITETYDAYRRRGVNPAPIEYAELVDAIEAARQSWGG